MNSKYHYLFQTELSHNLQQLSERARSTTEFIQRLKGMSDKVNVSKRPLFILYFFLFRRLTSRRTPRLAKISPRFNLTASCFLNLPERRRIPKGEGISNTPSIRKSPSIKETSTNFSSIPIFHRSQFFINLQTSSIPNYMTQP